MDPQEVLNFWFKEASPQQRFAKDLEFDQRIRWRFSEIYQDAKAEKTKTWRKISQGRLAEIIILDQFSRNMFRDKPEAFATDALALRLAQEAVAIKADQEIPIEQRLFLYMPYMHSENAKIHEQAVELFSQPGLEKALEYEWIHKRIIDRFGRYPHRNKILNRISTAEEVEFLKEKNSSF